LTDRLPSGSNSALGLSTCRSIVNQAGGTVDAENEPGDSAVFRVLLPHSRLDADIRAKASA
jgi:signal transduction histidine kinase